MNIFNKITLEALKRNRTRTFVTIIGVILSATMITCVTTLVTSLQNFMIKTETYNEGDWYGCGNAVSMQSIEELKNDERVSGVKSAEILGYAQLPESVNADKPFLYVLGTNSDFFSSMPVRIVSGRLPEKENEIILSSHLYTNGGIKYAVGDNLTLSLGLRQSGGYDLWQNNPYLNSENGGYASDEGELESEIFTVKSVKKYTVVGFFERSNLEDYGAPGFTAFTYSALNNSSAFYDTYFKTYKVSDAYDVSYSDCFEGSTTNTNSNLLMYLGESTHSAFYTILYSLAAIIISIIMIGSVSLIYNAFSISVSERTKQFGLLRSIGATKKQLRKSVVFESLVISGIGIPIGIGVGIIGIWGTLQIAGGWLENLYNGSLPEKISLHVNWASIVAAALIALVTALISVWVPSKRASKVSAIEAIRQTKEYKITPKSLKTPRFIEKHFGIEGTIANKQYKRNKSKYRTTVFSLVISIILFISATSFCAYIEKSVDGVFGTANYDVSVIMEEYTEKADGFYKEIENLNGITQKTILKATNAMLSNDDESVSTGFKAFMSNINYSGIPVEIVGVPDDEFKSFLKENRLKEAEFFDFENPKAIAAQDIRWVNYDTERIENYNVFSEKNGSFTSYIYNHAAYMKLTDDEKEDVSGKSLSDSPLYDSFTTAYTVTGSLPFGCDMLAGNCVVLVYPESVFSRIVSEDNEIACSMLFNSDNHKKLSDDISELGLSKGMNTSDMTVNDLAEEKEANRSLISIVRLFSYGFIALISLIAAANVFNTISTNINLRRREFAMLRSVGMSEKGVMKMMNYECLIYGLKALLIGLPVSCFVTALIFLAVNSGIDIAFFIPWYAVALAVICAFLVVFSSMLYSMRKIKNENVIDALKNENM